MCHSHVHMQVKIFTGGEEGIHGKNLCNKPQVTTTNPALEQLVVHILKRNRPILHILKNSNEMRQHKQSQNLPHFMTILHSPFRHEDTIRMHTTEGGTVPVGLLFWSCNGQQAHWSPPPTPRATQARPPCHPGERAHVQNRAGRQSSCRWALINPHWQHPQVALLITLVHEIGGEHTETRCRR